MRKILLTAAVCLLSLALLAGCGNPQAELPVDTEPSASATESIAESTANPADETTPTETEEDVEYEGDASSYYIDVVYAQQIERYYTAISQQWDESDYWEHEMSPLVTHYYDGKSLDNVGFTFMDLDGDGVNELIITDGMMIYDLYTMQNGTPVKLLTGWERNAYRLCQNNVIYNQGSNGAASTVFNYYQLLAGELVLVDSVVFDANKNFDNPWFRSSDGETPEEPLTEDEANAIRDSYPDITMLGIDLLDVQS